MTIQLGKNFTKCLGIDTSETKDVYGLGLEPHNFRPKFVREADRIILLLLTRPHNFRPIVRGGERLKRLSPRTFYTIKKAKNL